MFACGGQPTWLRCDAVRGGGSEREQCLLLGSPLAVSHFPRCPQANSGLLVLIPERVGLSNGLSCEAGSSSRHHNHHRFLQPEALQVYFPALEPWSAVCLAPQLFFPVHPHTNAGLPAPPAATFPAPVLQPPPCHESSPSGCPAPPLLPARVSVSSLTFWCRTSIHFYFLAVLVIFFVFKFAVVLPLVVRRQSVFTYGSILAGCLLK